MTELESFFSSDGALSEIISGYQPRTAQLEMAKAVVEAIKSGRDLIAEAQKSFDQK